jgi:integrase/recombinase XerD
MDALIQATKERHRPRDLAIFLILRYTGMRRESVATLRVRNLDPEWDLRNVREKGGKTRDIPLPQAVTQFLISYVDRHLPTLLQPATPDTPLFWSSWGQRRQGKFRRPIAGKNIWRLCKTYGRIMDQPMLKPHDLRHGVAMEILEQHHDLEAVRAMLGHTRIYTTQTYAQIRPAQLKRTVEFYKGKALDLLSS